MSTSVIPLSPPSPPDAPGVLTLPGVGDSSDPPPAPSVAPVVTPEPPPAPASVPVTAPDQPPSPLPVPPSGIAPYAPVFLTRAQADGLYAAIGANAANAGYSLKTADFVAVGFQPYALDTTAGPIVVTLPVAPDAGTSIPFADARGTWNTNPVTFIGNKFDGVAVEFVNSAQGTALILLYIDATTGWRILESGTKPHLLSNPTVSAHWIGASATATPGVWTGAPTSYAYQWQVSDDGATGWTDIGGATANSYIPVSGDNGKYLRVSVIAENSNGAGLPAFSAASLALEFSPFPLGAIAYWRMNEADGTRVDATGNGNDLTDNNGVGLAAGKITGAASFSGSNYLLAATPIIGVSDAFTIAGWVKPNSSNAGTYNIFFSEYGDFISLGVSNTGSISVNAGSGDTLNAGAIPSDQWTFVVCKGDGSNFQVRIDGETVASGTYSGATNPTPTEISGNAGNGAPFVGEICEMGVWLRELSDEEDETIRNGGNGLTYPA